MTQFSTQTEDFLSSNRHIYDVFYLANNANGDLVSTENPLPVTLGSSNVNIIGNISVPTTVTVNSSPNDPVHVHLTEIGTSGILTVPYMPVGGNINVTSGSITITGTPTVNVGNSVEISNDIGNPIPVTGNVNATLTGTSNISFTATQTDAFGRLRVSEPFTIIDAFNRYQDNGLYVIFQLMKNDPSDTEYKKVVGSLQFVAGLGFKKKGKKKKSKGVFKKWNKKHNIIKGYYIQDTFTREIIGKYIAVKIKFLSM